MAFDDSADDRWMGRDELLMRLGFDAAMAESRLGDPTYALRWRGHAHERTVKEAESDLREICERLVASGAIAADEDPFEQRIDVIEVT